MLWQTVTVIHALNNWLPSILRDGGMEPAQAGHWASITILSLIMAALALILKPIISQG